MLALATLLAASPLHAKGTGLIFVSNERSNNIIVLDPGSLKVVKDIQTAGRPRDMHFNADHTLLYAACGDDDVIDVIERRDVRGGRQDCDRPQPGGVRHR